MQKLHDLMKSEGYDSIIQMCESAIYDSVVVLAGLA